MTDWTKPKYPGDGVRIARLTTGEQIGDVRIQDYGNGMVRVATFLPGEYVSLPGDTPKVEPERSEWFDVSVRRVEADACFNSYVESAKRNGWRDA